MPTNNGKVTLAVIAQKLDNIMDKQADHYMRFEKHCADDIVFQRDVWIALTGKENTPGLATRVDRLEMSQVQRNKHFWIIYPALIITVLGWLKSILLGN